MGESVEETDLASYQHRYELLGNRGVLAVFPVGAVRIRWATDAPDERPGGGSGGGDVEIRNGAVAL